MSTNPKRRQRKNSTVAFLATCLLASSLLLPACTGGNDRLQSDGERTSVTAQDRTTGAFAPEEARDALVEHGIEPDHLHCAQMRLDPAHDIDPETVERLRVQCDATEQFAAALADNIDRITDQQRSCLTEKLLALEPDAITRLYAAALNPTPNNLPDPAVSASMSSCGISPGT